VVAGALIRNDRLSLKFLVAILMCEWAQFWFRVRDARQIKLSLIERTNIPTEQKRFVHWTALASALTTSRIFTAIDKLELTLGTRQELFSFAAELPEQSEIPNWDPAIRARIKANSYIRGAR
jgi:hypothetical protein